MIMGTPPSSANCLEGAGWPRLAAAADMRVPNPAAGMMTETFINWEKKYSSRGGGLLSRSLRRYRLRLALHRLGRTRGLGRRGTAGGAQLPLVEFAEDHLAGGGLQHRSHGNLDGLADGLARVIHHHHGAIVEISHALVVFFAFFEDENFHQLAGQHDGLERVGQLVDVEHFHALELRHFVEIEIVGHDLGLVELGQLDELEVHFADGREVIFHNLHRDRSHFLYALHHVESAAAAVALERIGGVRHQLQFAQHKLRQHQDAIEKSGLGDIGNAAINDDAGIQYLVDLLALLFAAEDAAQRGEVQQVAFVGADDEPHVGHEQHDQQLQEALGAAGGDGVANDQRKKIGAEDAEDATDDRADQPLQADQPQPHLKGDDGQADERAGRCRGARL